MNKRVCLLAFLVLLLGTISTAWAVVTVTVGTNTNSSNQLPVLSAYNYTYSQQMFAPGQINNSGAILAIRFWLNGASITNDHLWTVYMGHTSQNGYVTNNTWIPVGSMTQVFSGTVSVPGSGNWLVITLDQSFVYNGTDNLVIAVNETASGTVTANTWGGFWNDAFGWYNTMISKGSSVSIDPSNPGTGNANMPYNNYIQLDFEGNVPVELSSFTATITAQNFVNLTWVAQSETGMSGYYVYRADEDNLSTAQLISPLIQATNEPTQHSYTYTDSEIYTDGNYYYWLQSMDLDGQNGFHGPVTVIYNVNGDYETPQIPVTTELKAVYPNPFNPQAFIPYSIAATSDVNFQIYNSRGQLVWVHNPGSQVPGEYRLIWDGTDSNGRNLANGIYHIRMTAGKQVFQRSAVLLK